MRNWVRVFPAVLAAAVLVFTASAVTLAGDQTQTRVKAMDQTQIPAQMFTSNGPAPMYSDNFNCEANSNQNRWQETHMWAEQVANMGDTCQVNAGDPKQEKEKRGDKVGTGTGDAGTSGGGSRK